MLTHGTMCQVLNALSLSCGRNLAISPVHSHCVIKNLASSGWAICKRSVKWMCEPIVCVCVHAFSEIFEKSWKREIENWAKLNADKSKYFTVLFDMVAKQTQRNLNELLGQHLFLTFYRFEVLFISSRSMQLNSQYLNGIVDGGTKWTQYPKIHDKCFVCYEWKKEKTTRKMS